MKVWLIFSLFILGALGVVAGAAFKLMHWTGGNTFIGTGLGLQGLAGILVIIKLIKERK